MNRCRRNLESATLIWLTNKPDEIKLIQLRNIIDYVTTVADVHTCNDYINKILDKDQLYVITDTPYISTKAKVYEYQNNENFSEAVDSLKADLNTEINTVGINIFKQSTHSQLNSEFLWFQRILGVLLDNDDRDRAKKNLLDAYKHYFEGNRNKEKNIQLFENTYRSENALQWYTKECFFYDVLNKALRTQDIDILYSLRFFLKDMYNQLKIEYGQTSLGIDLIVYRAQTIFPTELKTIQENIGQLISLNSFISTTREEEMAKSFGMSGDPSGERVFFQIKVNKSITNPKPFADIALHSQFPDEKEVLFMAGSIFEIKNVSFSDSLHMWMIELDLCDENIYELYDVYESDRSFVSEQKSPFSFGAGLLRMNLFDKAKKYYQQLIDEGSMTDIPLVDLYVNCYWGLANVNEKQGEYDIALAYECLAIEQCQNRLDLLFRSYKYISLTYLTSHKNLDALEYQLKALEIQREIQDSQDEIADTLFNLGTIYFFQLIPELDCALDYYTQALNIYKELNLYRDLIRCYDAIGTIHSQKKKRRDLALNYHLQALDLIDEHFPTYLPYRIHSYEHIAQTYESMHNYEQAEKYYNCALDAKLKYEPQNDPNIACCYESLGRLYQQKREHMKALEMHDKAIEIRLKTQPESHSQVQSTVYTRNALQENIQNDSEDMCDCDSSSDEEPRFYSISEALNYMTEHMKTDEDYA